MSDLTLITFPPSLDSEFSRFLVHHYGIAHREERHTMPFSVYYSLKAGFSPRFPLLHGDGLRLDTVKKIIDHFEPLATPERRLVPPKLADAVRADWKDFHLLPHRDIMVRPLTEGCPAWQVEAVDRYYPAFEGLLRLLLRPTDKRGADALDAIRNVLDRVDQRLADGRRYLNGDRFSLSDMAFADAAAPVA